MPLLGNVANRSPGVCVFSVGGTRVAPSHSCPFTPLTLWHGHGRPLGLGHRMASAMEAGSSRQREPELVAGEFLRVGMDCCRIRGAGIVAGGASARCRGAHDNLHASGISAARSLRSAMSTPRRVISDVRGENRLLHC